MGTFSKCCCLSQFDGIHVVSGSLDTSIRVWDVETGNCIHTLTGHQSLTSGMELKDNILVSGNADSTVKIWDIKTGQCLQTLQGKQTNKNLVYHYSNTHYITPDKQLLLVEDCFHQSPLKTSTLNFLKI